MRHKIESYYWNCIYLWLEATIFSLNMGFFSTEMFVQASFAKVFFFFLGVLQEEASNN